MLRHAHILLLLVASAVCLTVPSSAQPALISTNSVQINVTSFGLNPATIRSVTIQGQYWSAMNGVFYANTPQTLTVANYPNLTNGVAVFTNQICGVPYSLKVATFYDVYTTNYFIPSTAQPDSTGNINAGQYVGTYISPSQFFWANPVVTNYNYTAFSGSVLWGTSTNDYGTTNQRGANLFFTLPPPPYNSTNYPHGTIYPQ